MNLKTGDLLHCRNKGLQSLIVGLCTKSDITHSAVVISIWNKIHIIEAEPSKGINIKTFENWQKLNSLDFEVSRLKDSNEKEDAIKLTSKSGITSYPLIKMLLVYTIHYFTNKWIRIDEDKMWCSAFAGWFRSYKDWQTMTPVDLYNREKSNKNIKFIK